MDTRSKKMKTCEREIGVSHELSDFEEKLLEFEKLKEKALHDAALSKIIQMRKEGLLSRPSFNLEYGPEIRITQLSNLE